MIHIAAKKQRVIEKPRISVNKLAQLIECSNGPKRKTIIRDSKYPKEYKSILYKDVRPAFVNFFAGQATNREIELMINQFKASVTGRADDRHSDMNAKLSADAMTLLLKADISPLKECGLLESRGNEYVKIAGVEISINPDTLLFRQKGNKFEVGALKLHLSKNDPLSDEAQKIVAGLLHLFVAENILLPGEIPVPGLCFSYDAFKENFESMPAAFKMRMDRITVACEEIALRWERL